MLAQPARRTSLTERIARKLYRATEPYHFLRRTGINIAKHWGARLPLSIQSLIASAGYPHFISRNNIPYTGRVYGTQYTINANSKYMVEIVATMRDNPHEAFVGIKQLDMKDATIIDVGANVGTYSIGIAGLGAKRIYAVEPGPFFPRLQANVTATGLGSIISCHNIGFGEVDGFLLWYEDLGNPGNAHLLPSREAMNTEKILTQLAPEGIKVPIMPFDKFVENNHMNALDLIKIDVEGMEWDVLSHAKKTIEKFKPIIVAETHHIVSDLRGVDMITPMFSYLYGLGYKTYSHTQPSNTPHGYMHNFKLKEFIYPNFTADTFFIHPDNPRFKQT